MPTAITVEMADARLRALTPSVLIIFIKFQICVEMADARLRALTPY